MILQKSEPEVFLHGSHWKDPKTAQCGHLMLTQCIRHQEQKLQQQLMLSVLPMSTSMHSNAVVHLYAAGPSHCYEILGCMFSAAQYSWEGKLVLRHISERMQHSAMERILGLGAGNHVAVLNSCGN